MGFFSNLKCKIGLHEWSKLSSKVVDNCIQKRKCKNCDLEDSETNHEWSIPEYTSIERCEKNKSCMHCQEVETELVHIWNPWQYESPKSCDLIRNCDKCKSVQEKRKASNNDHVFGISEQLGPNLFLHKCSRCGFELKNQSR
jgi:hypothetical protein